MSILALFLIVFSLKPYALAPETRVYDLFLKGSLQGTYYIDVDTATYEGKRAYKITYWAVRKGNEGEKSYFFISPRDFRPLYSRKVITGIESNSVIEAFYEGDSIKLKLKSPSGEKELFFPRDDSTFDNSSLYMILSALDFEGKPSSAIRVVLLVQGSILTADYSVGEVREVEINGSKIRVYPVALKMLGKEIEVLYGADPPHRLVRYLEMDSGSGFILREVEKK